jgi:hypothetical protein
MQDIAALLKRGLRRSEEAKARLRPLLALDGSVTGREEAPTEREVERAVESLKTKTDWKQVFPGLAQLEIVNTPGSGAPEVTLRIAKAGDGPAVHLATPGEAEGALLFRKSNPFDEYPIALSDFGSRLGVTVFQGYALIWQLKLKDDPAAYFLRKTPSGKGIRYQGLSSRAIDLAEKEMARSSFSMKRTVDAYKARNSPPAPKRRLIKRRPRS